MDFAILVCVEVIEHFLAIELGVSEDLGALVPNIVRFNVRSDLSKVNGGAHGADEGDGEICSEHVKVCFVVFLID